MQTAPTQPANLSQNPGSPSLKPPSFESKPLEAAFPSSLLPVSSAPIKTGMESIGRPARLQHPFQREESPRGPSRNLAGWASTFPLLSSRPPPIRWGCCCCWLQAAGGRAWVWLPCRDLQRQTGKGPSSWFLWRQQWHPPAPEAKGIGGGGWTSIQTPWLTDLDAKVQPEAKEPKTGGDPGIEGRQAHRPGPGGVRARAVGRERAQGGA